MQRRDFIGRIAAGSVALPFLTIDRDDTAWAQRMLDETNRLVGQDLRIAGVLVGRDGVVIDGNRFAFTRPGAHLDLTRAKQWALRNNYFGPTQKHHGASVAFDGWSIGGGIAINGRSMRGFR